MANKEEKEASGKGPKPKKGEDENPDFKFLVRISNTDIDGQMPLYLALAKVRGVGRRISIKIVDNLGFDRYKRIGDLTDEEVDRVQESINNIHDVLPHWMMNRQKDYDTGHDVHLIATEVQVARRDDINRFKKIRSYKGIRHERGHKVRGQRLKSNGRTGLVLGVSRKRK
jgi:small subunit ribosomal protein S13